MDEIGKGCRSAHLNQKEGNYEKSKGRFNAGAERNRKSRKKVPVLAC